MKTILPDTLTNLAGKERVCRPERALSSRLLVSIIRDVVIILLSASLPATALYGYRSLTHHHQSMPIAENVLWIDARSEAEFAKEHIPGALCLNEKNWEKTLPSLFKTWQPPQQIVVYCAAGCQASAKIAAKLTDLGFEPVRVMEGGFEAWKNSKS